VNRASPIIEGRAIGRRHPDSDRWLLRDINCRICTGDRIAIVGPSGSGKTLLLRALAALDPLDAGQILWNEQRLRGAIVPLFRRSVVYLHQRATLLEGTVEGNLREPYSLRGHRHVRFDRQRIEAWLARLGRDASFLRKLHRDLSGGEAQLAALLRAIQLDPHVLLLDEPTAALDRDASGAVEQLVELWYADRPEERATVWVSHDGDQADRVARKILRVDQGRIHNAG